MEKKLFQILTMNISLITSSLFSPCFFFNIYICNLLIINNARSNHAEGFDTSWVRNQRGRQLKTKSVKLMLASEKTFISTYPNVDNRNCNNMITPSLAILSSKPSSSSSFTAEEGGPSNVNSFKNEKSYFNNNNERNVTTLGRTIPSTYPEALKRFFLGPDHGPIITTFTILSLILYKVSSVIDSSSTTLFHNNITNNCIVGSIATLIWLFQEHFLHKHFLHSEFNWIGKEIHDHHHNQPYFHISIDSTPLLIGWLFSTSLVLHFIFPQPLALTGTICYSISGMWYEWIHFLVHTKVRPRSKFMKRVKDNHIRHHLLSDDYWLGFSLPLVDDLFGTNPSVQSVRKQFKSM